MNKQLAIFFLTFSLCSSALQADKTVHLFIHGTILIEQTFLLKTEQLLNSIGIKSNFFKQIIKTERTKPIYQSREPLLDLGLVHVPMETLDEYTHGLRSYQKEQIAAYPILAKFKQLLPTIDNQLFYTFGWSGTLLQKDRIEAGKELYEALIKLKKEYSYEKITFKLYTHSHGGAIALYLALFESKQQQNLSIDTLCFFGLPIQPETISYAQNPLFKTIINFYSEGDAVQTIDFVSTQAWQSRRKLSDFLDLSAYSMPKDKKMYDVRLLAHGDTKAIGHHSLWLYNKTRKILPFLQKLPIIAITPSLLEIVSKINTLSGDINIMGGENKFSLGYHDDHTHIKHVYFSGKKTNN